MSRIKLSESQLKRIVEVAAKKIISEGLCSENCIEEEAVAEEVKYPWPEKPFSEEALEGCEDAVAISRVKAASDKDFDRVMKMVERLYGNGSLSDNDIYTVRKGYGYVILLNNRRALGEFVKLFKYNPENCKRFGVMMTSEREEARQ